MRRLRYVLLFVGCLLLLGSLSGCHSEHDLTGVWTDVDDSYSVTFKDNGLYKESTYNLWLQYAEKEGQLLYNDPSGDLVCTVPDWTFRGNLKLYIGGKYREFQRTESAFTGFPWDKEVDYDLNATTDHYVLKSALGVDSQFFIAEDASYSLVFSAETDGGEYVENRLNGKLATSRDAQTMVLYYDGGESADIVRFSPERLYVGVMPLDVDGVLKCTVDYSNLSLKQERGYLLDGTVLLPESGVSYTFTPDSKCVKNLQGSGSIEYSYYTDMEGLITLGSTEGVLESDYLLYDAEGGQVYRLVYSRDSWYDFVTGLGASPLSATSSASDDAKYVAVPASNIAEAIAAHYIPRGNPQYSFIPELDAEYVSLGIKVLSSIRDRIEQEDEAWRAHDADVTSQREQLSTTVQSFVKEQTELKALLDARAFAAIMGGALTSTSTSQSSEGYNQGDAYYDPVVNIDDASSRGEGPSNTTETTTAAVPNDLSSEPSEPPVVQYDPAFHIDFVCTCVNCYVSSLPVEFEADNVLLVDSSVLAPGTNLNVEGYGMVIARASGGRTLGQTAVLYSKNHNAVIRFSSGVYNVYQTVE